MDQLDDELVNTEKKRRFGREEIQLSKVKSPGCLRYTY